MIIENLKKALAALVNPKKWILGLVSEKAVGTVLRHGTNGIGAWLLRLGFEQGLVTTWQEATLKIASGLILIGVAYVGSRVEDPKSP